MLAGCPGLSIPSGKLGCSAKGECPSGYQCGAGMKCWQIGSDGAATTDAPQDRPGQSDAEMPDSGLPEVPSCDPGQHLCPTGCVDSASGQTCGMSCSPCPTPGNGGTATCESGACSGTCPAGKKLCLGDCIDSAAACSGMCPMGEHMCGQSCFASSDVNACGTSCTPCPVPANAMNATCDSGKCGFACKSGYHPCGQGCAAASDATACGDACTVCPTDPHGTAMCAGGTCAIQCGAGYHLCGAKCVSNNDVASCGASSCTACPDVTGGMATCDGNACGGKCAASEILCNGACIAATQACAGQCPNGTHNCNGVCVDSTSTNSCGASCSACPKPTGANATSCTAAGTCDFTCGGAYHRCGDRCAANDDATACGAGCTACPTDPNGTAICQASGTCALSCATGFHPCGGKCVSNKDVATCGATACGVPCVAPTGGTVSCDGISCVQACSNGNQYVCQNACVDKSTACNGQCQSGYKTCQGACIPSANCCMNADCPAAKPICSSGTCVGKPLGQVCGSNTECASGFCVDGVCCNVGSCAACNRCNLNGVGTCSASPAGADASCPINATNCTAGCDGLGKCQAAPATTFCASSTCAGSDTMGSIAHVGVYVSTSYKTKKCDGTTAGPTGCKAQTDTGCPGNLICASASGCKPSCSNDRDCIYGYRCVSGACTAKVINGSACTLDTDCVSGLCDDQNHVCLACRGGASCTNKTPLCGDDKKCASCNGYRVPSDCHADGSLNCNASGACVFANAPDCNAATGLCSCGSVSECKGWMVCAAHVCKVAGGQPCINTNDCATGSCPAGGGVCPAAQTGTLCTGDFNGECIPGDYCGLAPGGCTKL